jgi:hypothetical protein
VRQREIFQRVGPTPISLGNCQNGDMLSIRYWNPLETPYLRKRIEEGGTPVPNLPDRLMELQHSLEAYPADVPTPWTIAQLFNALLVEVEKGWLDDPLVQAIIKAEIHNEPDLANVSIGEMRAAVGQMLMIVEAAPPRNVILETLEAETEALAKEDGGT